MQIIELKQDFGDKLTFMGGIDARAIGHPDPEVIGKEIGTKVSFAKKVADISTILTILSLTM